MLHKKKEFIAIIWGYHKQLFYFSFEENYHLNVLEIARNLGYNTLVYLINSLADIKEDTNFKSKFSDTKVLYYKNVVDYLFFLFSHRNSVIYANTLVWQSLISCFFSKNSVFIAHDSVKRKSRIKQIIQNFFFHHFSRIRVITQQEKEFLIRQGIKKEKIKVVPLSIDVNLFKEIDFSERDGLVFLGNVTPDKNISAILKAFEIVKEKKPNIYLDIIGEIRDDNFFSLVKLLNLEDSVRLIGFVPQKDLYKHLNQYKIYVNSSISEGQCLAAYEAALCGVALCLPLTLSFSGVFKGMALFHEINDYKKLAENILLYLENENVRKKYVKMCKEKILKEYNFKVISEKIKDLLIF